MSAIPLRPLDFGEVLDLGFGLFRRDYRLYMPLALVGLVPAMVATVIPTASEVDAEAIVADAGAVLPFFGLMAVGMVFSLLTWGALAAAMHNLMSDRPASIGSSYARALAALPRLVAAGILAVVLLAAVIFALAFPMVALVALAGRGASLASALISSFLILAMGAAVVGWWATHVFMLVPATVVEGRGPFAGLRRSFGLVRGSRMRAFFVVVVTWFISVMPGVAAYALAGSAGDLFAANPAQTIGLVRFWVIQIVGLGFQSVTTPLMMACAMVLFTDLKARSEGTDLEAAARAMAG
ncbi:MAG: hypothetical protein OXN92_14250 [Gammaproteobacteria bacterium]|nr:hypothetical protein [Gammaproteobacteria bacterium]